jgi:DNA-binding MarR family transcriptional regulator
MVQARQPVQSYEQRVREHFAPRGVDLDAQAALFLLFRTNTDTIAAMEPSLRPYGLTHAGFVLMMTLWIGGPQETRDLARVQRVSRPAIVSAVDTLERRGLVRRVRSKVDRRLVSIELTAKGETTIEAAQQAWHACEKAIASALTKREQRSFAEMLRRIGAAAQEHRFERNGTDS